MPLNDWHVKQLPLHKVLILILAIVLLFFVVVPFIMAIVRIAILAVVIIAIVYALWAAIQSNDRAD